MGLEKDFPGKWEYYLDRLSCHIASTGKRYKSHAATIYKWAQEDGFLSSLPLGHNGIEIKRGMTTSSTAIFVPFMTQELRMRCV